MRKATLALLLCTFAADLAFASSHGDGYSGGTVNWDRITVSGVNYYSGQGGEFTITGSTLDLSAYVVGTTSELSGTNSFQTFCLEKQEYVRQPMNAWVSTEAAGPGDPVTAVNPFGSHAWEGGTGQGDDLDPRTAYLYTQFATGSLSSLGYVYTGSGRTASAAALQNVIWAIEGESGSSWSPNPTSVLETAFFAAAL